MSQVAVVDVASNGADFSSTEDAAQEVEGQRIRKFLIALLS